MRRWLFGLFRVAVILVVAAIVSAPAWPVGPPSTKLILLFLITVAIGAWVAGPKSPDELGWWW